MGRFIRLALFCLPGLISTLGHAQSNYAEFKGALEWIPRLSLTDENTNTTRLNTTDPAWHGTATFGWPVNEMLSLETDVSIGRRNWNQKDGDTAPASTEEASYAAAMVNALLTPRLSDELVIGLGIGGGFLFSDFNRDLIPAAEENQLLMPGYQ